jgi:agmatinase
MTAFFRLPAVGTARDESTALAGVDAVLLGVPYDGGTTYQPGARLAPFHVRRVSALLQTFHPGHGVDVFRSLKVVDGGNVAFPPFDAAAVRECIHAEVTRVVAAGAVPLLLGGDHTIAYPAMRAVAARHGPLAVVHVDAHADTSGPETWGDAWHHGTPLRHALDEKLIERGQLHQIGLRAPWDTAEDGTFAGDMGARAYTMEDVATHGIEVVMKEIKARVGNRPVYLTFDIDGIDPAYAPGTGTPVPGGLTSREALTLVRGLAGLQLVGMDLVEVCPSLDHADITSHLAAYLMFEMLAAVAAGRELASSTASRKA